MSKNNVPENFNAKNEFFENCRIIYRNFEGRKDVFKRIIFEKDYGVDVGILLDVINLNVRVKEVSIGSLTNDQHEWSFLNKMAEEVMMAIIRRRYN